MLCDAVRRFANSSQALIEKIHLPESLVILKSSGSELLTLSVIVAVKFTVHILPTILGLAAGDDDREWISAHDFNNLHKGFDKGCGDGPQLDVAGNDGQNLFGILFQAAVVFLAGFGVLIKRVLFNRETGPAVHVLDLEAVALRHPVDFLLVFRVNVGRDEFHDILSFLACHLRAAGAGSPRLPAAREFRLFNIKDYNVLPVLVPIEIDGKYRFMREPVNHFIAD